MRTLFKHYLWIIILAILGFQGSFWRLIFVFWRPQGTLKTTFGPQNPLLGGDCVQERSLKRPQVTLNGPKCLQIAPKDARRASKRKPKRTPNGGKTIRKCFFYEKLANIKNDDRPTRKPHFSGFEGTKNWPKCVPNCVFSVLKSIIFLQCLKWGLKRGVTRNIWQQRTNT